MSQTSSTALLNLIDVLVFYLISSKQDKNKKKLFLVSLKFLFPFLTMRNFLAHSGVLGTNWLNSSRD